MPDTLSTVELAREAGVSYRQVDYWIRAGYIAGTHPGSGGKRQFDADAVAAVKMMAALVNVGIRPDAAAEYYPPLVQDGEARMWAAPQLWLVLEDALCRPARAGSGSRSPLTRRASTPPERLES
jgi:DNA-binding transcriptional MerR regulator